VVLWGQGLPVDEVATAAGTVGYELLCAVTPRVPFAIHSAQVARAPAPALAT
ncbi:MAG TPA: alanine racemase C-terminal domain-containing protein, partial [Casimicrobiaceae bacterium]